MTVGDPSVYSHVNVSANVYPTTIHYDATSGTYVVNDGQQNIGFSRSEMSLASQLQPILTISTPRLRRRSSSSTRAYQPGDCAHLRELWQMESQTAAANRPQRQLCGVWIEDSLASVPRSGSASYNFIIDGTYQLNGAPTNGKTYGLSGNGRLTADFASATTGITLSPVATNTANGSMIQFGTLTGGGFIDAGSSSCDQPNARCRRNQDLVPPPAISTDRKRRRSARCSR